MNDSKTTFFTIYKITNLINGKIYIGRHTSLKEEDDYFGSGGKHFQNALKKYGKENFSKETLFFCKDYEEMIALEEHLVNKEFVERKDTYNVNLGGTGGWETIFNGELTHYMRVPEYKEKRKETSIEKYGHEINYSSEEFREQCKEKMIEKYGVDNPSKVPEFVQKSREAAKLTIQERYGVNHISHIPGVQEKRKESCREIYGVDIATQNESIKDKANQKRKETLQERYGVEFSAHVPGASKKCSEALKGRIWVTNGKENLMKFPDEILEEGWFPGLTKTTSNHGRITINNGIENKMILLENLDAFLDDSNDSWVRGLLKKNSEKKPTVLNESEYVVLEKTDDVTKKQLENVLDLFSSSQEDLINSIKSKLLNASGKQFQKQWLHKLSNEEIEFIENQTINYPFLSFDEKALWVSMNYPLWVTKEFLKIEHYEKEKTLKQISSEFSFPGRSLSILLKGFSIDIKKIYHLGHIPSKEEFEYDYIINGLHQKEIMKKWNIGNELYDRLFKKYNIKKRNRIAHNKIYSDSFDKKELEFKLKSTNLTSQEIADSYGISHPTFFKILNELEILEKDQSILNYRYGRETSFGNQSQVEKKIKTCQEKYGTNHPPSYSNTRDSKEEKEILNFCRNYIDENSKKTRSILSGSKEIDVFIPKYNLAIEHNGLYWHCSFHPYMTKDKHKNKFDECLNNGIQLITIWDHEFHSKKEIIFSIIKAKCGIFERKLQGRKCFVSELSFKEAKLFYEENHIQGSSGNAQMKWNVALLFENEIVGMMSFGHHHRGGNENTLVLSRCCFKKNTSIIGGSKKMFSFFIKKYSPEKIITWSDNRYSLGLMYPSLGFEKDEEFGSDYFYYNIKNNEICSKQSCQKKHLLSKGGIGKTENEMAISLNYYRIYDCGKIRWIWKNTSILSNCK